MVTGVARTWSRSGDARPLSVRHAEVAEKLIRLGGTAIYPLSEGAIDQMEAETARRKQVPEEISEATREAGREFIRTVNRYQVLFDTLRKDQLQLESLRRMSDEHRLLGDITDEILALPPSGQQVIDKLFGKQNIHPALAIPGKLNIPDFFDAPSYKSATLAMLAAVHDLENIAAKVRRVFDFEVMGKDSQNRTLILAQQRRIEALQAKLDRLEASTTPAATKQRPIQRRA
jgi:hypothetical protein